MASSLFPRVSGYNIARRCPPSRVISIDAPVRMLIADEKISLFPGFEIHHGDLDGFEGAAPTYMDLLNPDARFRTFPGNYPHSFEPQCDDEARVVEFSFHGFNWLDVVRIGRSELQAAVEKKRGAKYESDLYFDCEDGRVYASTLSARECGRFRVYR